MKIKRVGLVMAVVLGVVLFFLNRSDVTLTKQDTFSVTPIGNTGYQLKSVLHLHNPNLLSSTIKTISEKFYIEGREVAILNTEISQGIPGLKETTFPVTVRFSKADLLRIFLNDSLLTNFKAEINIIGEITFENLMSSGKIPVNQKDSVIISVF